ncbi:hypothetical protein J4404_03110 [Candidatus Woesearchaeota archaeon]|nr:hypothetical protein [Candidatus Woesearchaeota archaeon]
MFNLLKRKDPVCGMTEKKEKGFEKNGKWFCSKDCLNKFEKEAKSEHHHSHHGCCL